VAHAATLVGYYEASWASLPAGHLVASFDDDDSGYRDTLRLDTVGLPRLLLHFRAEIESAGTFGPGGAAQPTRYALDYDLRKHRGERVRVAYAAHDGATIAERTPDDTNRKPVLPEQYRRDVIDPVAALAAVRHHLQLHGVHPGDRFTLPVFDDVRRFDLAVTVRPAVADKLVHVHLELTAIAGFKGRKNGRDPDDAPRPLDLTFTDDARLMPQSLTVSVVLLPLVVRLDHVCADMAHCDAAPTKKQAAKR
jgi:hypothetical protein